MPLIDVLSFREEVEQERLWRESEIRLLKNNIANIEDFGEQKILRKALIVMLYAYFEGMCKFIFTSYIHHLNKLELQNSQVAWSLLASSFAPVFKALNSDTKNKYFKSVLPNDEKLHRFARQKEFVENFSLILSNKVSLDEKEIVDLESNIKPFVLKKVLYLLGFKYEKVDDWSGKIEKLLKFRNDVAHGSRKDGIGKADYQILEDEVLHIVDSIVFFVSESINNDEFVRH